MPIENKIKVDKVKNRDNLVLASKLILEFLESLSINNEIIINNDIKKKATNELGYTFKTINSRISNLKTLKFIEIVERKCSNYKRSKHKQFIPGTKEYAKSAYLKYKYGISVDDYDKMLIQQEYKCEICGSLGTSSNFPLHVDHCHSSRKVRGLLCFKCNTSIGNFEEDIKRLESAINYLKKYS